MLTLRYCFSAQPAPAVLADPTALGTVVHARAPVGLNAIGGAADLAIATPSLDGDVAIEQWLAAQTLRSGSSESLHYRHNTDCVFGAIALDEADFTETAQRSALQLVTAAAYERIFALLDQLGMPQLWRVWHFIPRINAADHGLERYRQFNIERRGAFARSGRALTDNVPAASAVGTADGPLTLYFLAGRSAPLTIENPRQISAFHYPAEYGPISPIFARAIVVRVADADLLFISGTASIVGHRTLHTGDVRAQTRELLANIDCVLAEANAKTQRCFARGDLAYKVYVRHADDSAAVKAEIEHWLGAPAAAIYVRADICRADLLVEVEASAGHALEIVRA